MTRIINPRLESRALSDIKAQPRNARVHPRKQIQQLARSIERFGFNAPILVDQDDTILAGHGRFEAARLLKLPEVPVIRLDHLSPLERRAYLLADNRIALSSSWDGELLANEIQALMDDGFEITDAGFAISEVDDILLAADDASPSPSRARADRIPDLEGETVTRSGDIWELGRHRLVCGDARDPTAYQALLGEESVDLLLTDPPYNVRIEGNVSGRGAVVHGDFAFASGEMSPEAFTVFLSETLGVAASRCRDGAIAFVFMDWRHMGELLAAGGQVFSELKNVCVWNKTNGGQGVFYRSKHEMVFVWKVGKAEHVNTFGLGGTGRYRTNVWDYAGVTAPTKTRSEELSMHPTVKPVALLKDAILDCTHRGHIVLDVFGGSGSTLIAAQKCGRLARLIEYEPRYCDVILKRYETLTGKPAILKATGETFEEVRELRLLGVTEEEAA
jgi:DNA modification methylase